MSSTEDNSSTPRPGHAPALVFVRSGKSFEQTRPGVSRSREPHQFRKRLSILDGKLSAMCRDREVHSQFLEALKHWFEPQIVTAQMTQSMPGDPLPVLVRKWQVQFERSIENDSSISAAYLALFSRAASDIRPRTTAGEENGGQQAARLRARKEQYNHCIIYPKLYELESRVQSL